MNLYPNEVIEIVIAGCIILIALAAAMILYWMKKWKSGFYIAAAILISIAAFFVIRPYWMDYQIDRKTIILEEYLQAAYPDADWTISAVDFREYKTINPYYLLVDFSDDSYNTYYYFVDNNGAVEQMGSSSDADFLHNQKYGELGGERTND